MKNKCTPKNRMIIDEASFKRHAQGWGGNCLETAVRSRLESNHKFLGCVIIPL